MNDKLSTADFLDEAELIVNAATFELGSPAPGLKIDTISPVEGVDSEHILKRHTRKYQSLGSPEIIINNPDRHKDTTLYPEDTTEDDIADYIDEAQKLAGGTRNYLLYHSNDNFAQKRHCSVPGGGPSTIGYDYLSPDPPPRPPGLPAGLWISQFYPESSGDKVTINHSDMVAIKKALGK